MGKGDIKAISVYFISKPEEKNEKPVYPYAVSWAKFEPESY
jgi:hypothetical protein